MITLFKFGAMGKVCDPSAFCVKVETYLKMAGLDHDTKSGAKYMRGAPKGKLPYIMDGDQVVADSSFIIRHLENHNNHVLDGHLDSAQKATAHAFMKMIDENLYWAIVYSRWGLDHNWEILKKLFLRGIPLLLKPIMPGIIRKRVMRSMHGQGISRHSDSEIVQIADWDLKALSDYLGDKDFFFGEKPSSLDAAAFGVLSQMVLEENFTAPVFDQVNNYQNLVDFTHRIQGKYFGDLT